MRIDRAFVGWGLFFILVGAVPLAVRGGALTRTRSPTGGASGRSSSSASVSA